MDAARYEPRTYGGWRQSRGLGAFGLTGPETALIGFHLFVLIGAFGWARQALLPVAVSSVVAVALIARVEGIALWTMLWRETAWHTRRLRGRGEWMSPLVWFQPEAGATLPGPLAATVMYQVSVAGHATYGAVYNQRSGEVTVSFVGNAQTIGLADHEETDIWVSNWGTFLSSLPDIPQIKHVAVTVATATDPSPAVKANLDRMRSEHPPDLSARIMDDVADYFSAGTQRTRTMVSVTFDPRWAAAGWARKPETVIPEIHGHVMSITAALQQCGLTSLRPATAHELAAEVRAAFSPAVAGDAYEAVRTPEGREALRWDLAAPTTAEDHRTFFEHDGARTVTWALVMPPRETVTATILTGILRPSTFTKRVTLWFHPLPAAKAQRHLEGQRFMADVKRRLAESQQSHETARELHDRSITDDAARSEALGAGYGTFTLVVAVTVPTTDSLSPAAEQQLMKQAELDVTNGAASSRLTLRRLDKSHGLGLTATLPAGINITPSLEPK